MGQGAAALPAVPCASGWSRRPSNLGDGLKAYLWLEKQHPQPCCENGKAAAHLEETQRVRTRMQGSRKEPAESLGLTWLFQN